MFETSQSLSTFVVSTEVPKVVGVGQEVRDVEVAG